MRRNKLVKLLYRIGIGLTIIQSFLFSVGLPNVDKEITTISLGCPNDCQIDFKIKKYFEKNPILKIQLKAGEERTIKLPILEIKDRVRPLFIKLSTATAFDFYGAKNP